MKYPPIRPWTTPPHTYDPPSHTSFRFFSNCWNRVQIRKSCKTCGRSKCDPIHRKET